MDFLRLDKKMIEGTPNTTMTDGRTPLKIIREISEEAYVKET